MITPYADLGPHAEFPEQIITDTTMRGGLRHVQLGEDGETWVFLGHPLGRHVLDAIAIINREDHLGWEDDELPELEDLTYTFGRLVSACPDHPGRRWEGCDTCRALSESTENFEDGWYLDWSGNDKDRNANKGKPGYFPVVLWDVECGL